jgi:hypothetical protein
LLVPIKAVKDGEKDDGAKVLIAAHAVEYVEKNDLKCLFDLNVDGGNEESRLECCKKTGDFFWFQKGVHVCLQQVLRTA